jgi:serine/threonine protein kinase
MVFEAVHLAVGSRVAVKVMQPQQRDVQVAVQRFHKEARILGAVKHPHAVLITDFDVDERGGEPVAFLVTELLRGRSLAALLDAQKTLAIDDVERVVTPLCDALEEAHAQGIIHRDLKPSNVFLERLRDGSEVVKVLDFGIAKLLSRARVDVPKAGEFGWDTAQTNPEMTVERDLRDEILSAIDDDDEEPAAPRPTSPTRAERPGSSTDPEGAARSTWAGLMVGTVPYMAPEQMTGEPITRRADVHALAVVVFEMLAGRLPFDGDDDDILQNNLAATSADERPSLKELGVGDVDEALDALLQRCFAVDPQERPDSVRVIADAVAKAARARRGDVVVEPVSALSLRLSTAARALQPLEDAGDDDAGRDRCRDTLLAAGVSLEKARPLLPLAQKALSAPPQAQLVSAHLELDDAVAAVRDPLTRIAARDVDGGAYLLLLWRRIDAFVQAVGAVLDGQDDDAAGDGHDALAAVLADTGEQRAPVLLPTLAQALLSKDALEAADALDTLLDDRATETAAAVVADDELGDQLRAGLWRHADAVLLRDVGAERQALRFVPLLAQHEEGRGAVRRFAAVVAALRDRRGVVVVDELRAALGDAARPGLRCLLLHPQNETRAAAARALAVVDLWTVIAHPRTPLPVLRFVFSHLREHGRPDHLKVLFFCVKGGVAASSVAELRDAMAFVRDCFDVACFHEDLLFEPLLELERGLRSRADAAGILDESYVRAVSAFVDVGAREEAPLDHLRDVPLPIQRKLAREGLFLTSFVCHHNERVARETVPHLLRLDDVTRFLRMTLIHRAVLVELAKRRRFFKKDAPKLALLGNPKTPAAMARAYLGLVSEEQLRTLSTSRQINPDVRRLILQALARELR